MERLSNYAASSGEVLPEFLQVEAFSKLSQAIGKVVLIFYPYRFIVRNLIDKFFYKYLVDELNTSIN